MQPGPGSQLKTINGANNFLKRFFFFCPKTCFQDILYPRWLLVLEWHVLLQTGLLLSLSFSLIKMQIGEKKTKQPSLKVT